MALPAINDNTQSNVIRNVIFNNKESTTAVTDKLEDLTDAVNDNTSNLVGAIGDLKKLQEEGNFLTKKEQKMLAQDKARKDFAAAEARIEARGKDYTGPLGGMQKTMDLGAAAADASGKSGIIGKAISGALLAATPLIGGGIIDLYNNSLDLFNEDLDTKERARAGVGIGGQVAGAAAGAVGGFKGGAALGGILGTVFGPVGTALGAAIGGGVGAVAGGALGFFFGDDVAQAAFDGIDKAIDFLTTKLSEAAEFMGKIFEPIGQWVTEKWAMVSQMLSDAIDSTTAFFTDLYENSPLKTGVDFLSEKIQAISKAFEDFSFSGVLDNVSSYLVDNFAEIGLPKTTIKIPLLGEYDVGPFYPFRPSAEDLTAEEKEKFDLQYDEKKKALMEGTDQMSGVLGKLSEEEAEKFLGSREQFAYDRSGKQVSRVAANDSIRDLSVSGPGGAVVAEDYRDQSSNISAVGGTSFVVQRSVTSETAGEGIGGGLGEKYNYNSNQIFGEFDDQTGKATLTVGEREFEVSRSSYTLARQLSDEGATPTQIIDAVNKNEKEQELGFFGGQGFFESDEDYAARLDQMVDKIDLGLPRVATRMGTLEEQTQGQVDLATSAPNTGAYMEEANSEITDAYGGDQGGTVIAGNNTDNSTNIVNNTTNSGAPMSSPKAKDESLNQIGSSNFSYG